MVNLFKLQAWLVVCSYQAAVSAQLLTQCPTTPQSQVAASGQLFNICPGTDLQVPSPLVQPGVPDVLSCLQLCDSNAGCTMAVYNKGWSTCYLKGNGTMKGWTTSAPFDIIYATPKLPDDTIIKQCPYSEQSSTTSQGKTFAICPGSDYRGNTIQDVYGVATAQACAAVCGSTSGCTKAVYSAAYQACHLKDSAGPLTWVTSSQYLTIRLNSPSISSSSTTTTSSSTKSLSTITTLLTTTTTTTRTAATPPSLPPTVGGARRPMMGYNSYNHVGCSPNNDVMNASMIALANNGFIGLGYQYFQIDCGWQGFNRLSNGSITYDASVFPYGIKPLSDRARSLGFKWSMYTDQGVYSCDTQFAHMRPGSYGYETQDAAMFAAWNTEYVKVDNCFIDANNNAPKDARSDFPSRYTRMWNALQRYNIQNMLICQWGTPYLNPSTNTLQGPDSWAPPISTSYRLTDDISYGTVNWLGVLRIYNQAIHLNWNGHSGSSVPDLDLLEVGNPGLTVDEQKTHFAVWATFKSSLMISTDPTNMSPATKSILSNTGLIAINQDALCAPIKLVQRYSNNYDVFLGPLANGDQVVMIVDHSNTQRTLNLPLSFLGMVSADVTDVWSGNSLGSSLTSVSQTVAAHGSMVLRLSRVVTASPANVQYNYVEAESGTRGGGAFVGTCPTCSGGLKVGGITQNSGNTLTISNIYTSKTTQNVLFDYINADVQYLGSTTGSNRAASISINGGPGTTVLFPLSGYDWSGNGSIFKGFPVSLSGFNTNGPNSMTISTVPGLTDTPDFDRFAFAQ